jgi:histidinol-phosphate/aromatic aminotransferase/cobyric acid decarboxylase-like protein
MDIKQQIKEKIKALKAQSGTHSPSIATILREVPDIKIEVDACFLSNPYATELFLKYLDNDLIKSGKLKDVLEYYPPQNYDVSQYISKAIKTDARNIFVGNGAIEAIQAVIHNFVKKKICVILPTFSSYYEFVKEGQEVIYYHLKKEENYELNAEDFIAFVRKEQPDSIVIINPNNPNGGYLNRETIIHLIENLKHLDNIIIDESFIHFAYEDIELSNISGEELIHKYPNLVIIKSMSKDFGIAGVRAGYAVMHEDRVRKLLNNGYLWNVSGLADYFFKIYADPGFIEAYDIVRKKYILNTMAFLNDLNAINGIKVYPSKANFALVEILGEQSSFDFSMNLLVDNGIYVRDCSDKIGLEGKFLRIASRSFEENLRIVSAIKKSIREA